MVYIILANGFEEIEALAAVDILRRGGAETATAGVGHRNVTGAHAIPVVADMTAEDVTPRAGDFVVIPGGLKGVENCEASEAVAKLLKAADECGATLCAICAGPRALCRLGLLDGVKITCYPGMDGQMAGAAVCGDSTVAAEKRITGRGPGSAIDFGLAILRAAKGDDAADEVATEMHYTKAQ